MQNDGCAEIIGGLILFALFAGGTMFFNAMSCGSRWSDFETSWGPLAGCRVQVEGRWIPEDRVREVRP